MTRVRVEGVDYTPEGVLRLRAELIEFRDEALAQNAFGPTVVLSHAIAYLAEYAEVLEEKEKP